MRFFADHCVPSSIISNLREEGHEVLVLKEYLPTDAPDSSVIEKADSLDSLLISLNGDFTDLTRYPPSEYNGIITLQVRNRPEAIDVILDRLFRFITSHPDQNFYHGKLLLVESHRIRIRQ